MRLLEKEKKVPKRGSAAADPTPRGTPHPSFFFLPHPLFFPLLTETLLEGLLVLTAPRSSFFCRLFLLPLFLFLATDTLFLADLLLVLVLTPDAPRRLHSLADFFFLVALP